MLKEYASLSSQLKLDILFKAGVYIGKRKVNDQIVVLYQLNDFYVEVAFISYRCLIDYIIVSNDMKILKPYLDQVSISALDWAY